MAQENDRERNLRPLALSLTVAGAILRLLPHPPNFAPVGGMSLYAGARLRGWQAFAVPLLLMAVTDPLRPEGSYSIATPFVYLSFMISVWIGRRLQATVLRYFEFRHVARLVCAYLVRAGALLRAGHSVLWTHAGRRSVLLRRSVRPACMAEPHGANRRAGSGHCLKVTLEAHASFLVERQG